MYQNKKKRLYIVDIVTNPSISYPAYYTLSISMFNNEMLQGSITMLHSFEFGGFKIPNKHEDIFSAFLSGIFPIFKERYIMGYFGGKIMYLETSGWKGMPATEDLFRLENWLI